MIIDILKVGK